MEYLRADCNKQIEVRKQLLRSVKELEKTRAEARAEAEYVLVPTPSALKNSENENMLDKELLNMQI